MSQWRNGPGASAAWIALGLVGALAACGGREAEMPAAEDCAAQGDEDGNGLADCEDLACSSLVQCPPRCGNGRQEAGESCDDGNLTDDDGCDRNCRVTGCGNGVVTSVEACDDGNQIDGDGCDHNCRVTGCGNGVVTAGEACDDGNLVDGDGCDRDCTVTVEVCGNGVVSRGEACDDGNTVDGDGCDASCQPAACPGEVPVEPGGGGSFALEGQIAKLVADPASCFLYVLDTASPSHLIVISTASKHMLARVELFEDANDIAMSPTGAYLAISYATNSIGVFDTATWQQRTRVPTFAAPYSLAATDDGVAFYGERQRAFHRIDMRDASGDGAGLSGLSSPQIAVSRDGHSLWVGEWGTAGGELVRYDITGGTPVLADQSTMGFYYPPQYIYASAGGQHVYYANQQFSTRALAGVRAVGERIFAEDVAGTLAIGDHHVFDARALTVVATLPRVLSAAALTAGDRELWYYSPDTGRIYYLDPQELISGLAPGRDSDPGQREPR